MSATLGEVGKTMRDAGFYSLPGIVDLAGDFLEQIHAHSEFTALAPYLSVGKNGALNLMFPLNTRRGVKGENKKVATMAAVSCEALIESPSKAAARSIREATASVEELINRAA